jgi:DNA-nicking Smr family endonuclease
MGGRSASGALRPAPAEAAAAELFAEAVRDARPLPPHGRAQLARPKPPPRPAQRLADERRVLRESLSGAIHWDCDLESGEQLAFRRDGIARDVFRKLRRGHWVVQRELDLHGLTRDRAHDALLAFLEACRRDGVRCVRVIHGKGLGSRHREPVLKSAVARWLTRRSEVLACCEAPPHQGGAGAALVLLAAPRPAAG